MTCACNLIVRRWTDGRTISAEGCRNADLHARVHDACRIEMPVIDPLVLLAAQIAWWLPKPTVHPKPGGAQRLPDELQLALVASDADIDPEAVSIRAQIVPDLEWKRCVYRTLDLHGQTAAIRQLERDGAGGLEREWGRDVQRRAEAQEWDERGRILRYGNGLGLADRVTLHVAAENIPPGAAVVADANGYHGLQPNAPQTDFEGLAAAYVITREEANRLKLDVSDERSTRPSPTNREAGRSFLLSKQRRQHRGAR